MCIEDINKVNEIKGYVFKLDVVNYVGYRFVVFIEGRNDFFEVNIWKSENLVD